MKKRKGIIVLLMTVLVLSGCASLMFGVGEMSGTPEIRLAEGEEVEVLMPTIDESISKELSEAGYTTDGFASMIQMEFVKEFNSRGLKATEGDSASGNYLEIHINEYEKGIGFLRVFYIPILSDMFAKSKLGGVVSLDTSEGKREVEVNKRGHKSGRGTGGDQTRENMKMMAKATVAKLTE